MPDPSAQLPPAYVMSHTDRERRRLVLQASVINPFTSSFLRDAGIAKGMRVLDLGCGVGDVSLIAAQLVGEHGSVSGIDIDPEALTIAERRASDEELTHVRFQRADLGSFKPERPYDAVVGRNILIHTLDPVALLSRAQRFVNPGGIVAFQEFDLSFFGPRFDGMPSWTQCFEAIPLCLTRSATRSERVLAFTPGSWKRDCRFQLAGSSFLMGAGDDPLLRVVNRDDA